MQDNLKVPINGVSNSSNSVTDKLEEAMWQLKLQSPVDEDGVVAGNLSQYPDRPGEPDCIYYLRTGSCGYGSNCRFNHPASIVQVVQHNNEVPERPGQPDCQYFLKTGTCKFGPTCKYHHPKDKSNSAEVALNVYGLPMRQGEKQCPYYMRTWSCKFGFACKFHHPQPAGVGTVLPLSGPSTYESTGSSAVSSSGMPYVGGLPAWSLPRMPSVAGLPLQTPQTYMPLILSPSQGITATPQRWNTYMGESGSPVQVGFLSESAQNYPERPDQPDCQYYMKTGRCKFGSDCKYHHPKEKLAPLSTCDLGPFGLPLRPGQAVCNNYSMYGICKYGSTCKFDHPWTGGYYNYGLSMPTLSIVDPALFSNQIYSKMPRLPKTPPSKSSKFSDRTKFEAARTEDLDLDTKVPDASLQETTVTPPSAPNSSEHSHNSE